MKATRFNTPAVAKAEIAAAFDLNATAPVWGYERAQEIGQLIYCISGGFSRRRISRRWVIPGIAGAYRDLNYLETDTAARARAWLDMVTVPYHAVQDLTAYPQGIDIANPNDNAAAEAFFAETAALHEIARGDLHSLTAFYLLYKRDWQDCQSLQREYLALTGKYYGGYPVM